jgi:hypothetical protein
MSDTAIIAGAAGGGGALFILVGCTFFYMYRRSSKHEEKKTQPPPKDVEKGALGLSDLDLLPPTRVMNPVFDDRASMEVSPSHKLESPFMFPPGSPVPMQPLSEDSVNTATAPPPAAAAPVPVVTHVVPEPASQPAAPAAASDTPAEGGESRSALLRAMRESRAKRKEDEWSLVHEALAIIDSLPLDD